MATPHKQDSSSGYEPFDRQHSSVTEKASTGRAPPFSYATATKNRPTRIVKRSTGRSLVKHIRMPTIGWLGYFNDSFTTLINAPWYVIVLLFTALYVVSWLIFGFAWWTLDAAYQSVNNVTCVSEVGGFSSSFLFSLETQMTIGYGFRYISHWCGFGVFLLIIQSLVGLFIDSFLLGLVFSKISRPRNRRNTILFSHQACICEINGRQCLQFRIADIRERSSFVEAHVRVQLYWFKKTGDNKEERTLYQEDLEVGYDNGRDRVILLTPVTITHPITETSPLYSLNIDNLLSEDLEIVVILEGIVESTGLTAQALWSYTEEEIMAGYRFVPMTYRRSSPGKAWEVDFSLISRIVPCNTPSPLAANTNEVSSM